MALKIEVAHASTTNSSNTRLERNYITQATSEWPTENDSGGTGTITHNTDGTTLVAIPSGASRAFKQGVFTVEVGLYALSVPTTVTVIGDPLSSYARNNVRITQGTAVVTGSPVVLKFDNTDAAANTYVTYFTVTTAGTVTIDVGIGIEGTEGGVNGFTFDQPFLQKLDAIDDDLSATVYPTDGVRDGNDFTGGLDSGYGSFNYPRQSTSVAGSGKATFTAVNPYSSQSSAFKVGAFLYDSWGDSIGGDTRRDVVKYITDATDGLLLFGRGDSGNNLTELSAHAAEIVSLDSMNYQGVSNVDFLLFPMTINSIIDLHTTETIMADLAAIVRACKQFGTLPIAVKMHPVRTWNGTQNTQRDAVNTQAKAYMEANGGVFLETPSDAVTDPSTPTQLIPAYEFDESHLDTDIAGVGLAWATPVASFLNTLSAPSGTTRKLRGRGSYPYRPR